MDRLETAVRLRVARRFARLDFSLVLLTLLLGVTLAPAARAAEVTPAQKLEMKQLYERATRAYDVGKYNEAIEEYQKAYEIGGDPPMLYNIAQAYRLNDQPNEALRFYRRYLQRAPNARNREDVERKIAELEKSVEEHRKAAAAATPPPLPAPPLTTSPTPAPSPVPAPIVGPPTPVAPPAPTATPGPETPPVMVETGPSQARQVVAWSFIGAGVLAGAGAVVTGLIAHGKSNDITNMSAAGAVFDPNIEHDGKLFSNMTIGLGIAGGALAVTGVIVLLTGGGSSPAEAPAQESAPPPTAMITPWLGSGLVGAGAGFRF